MFVMDGAVGEGKAGGMQKDDFRRQNWNCRLQIADFRFQIGRPVVARCEICNLKSAGASLRFDGQPRRLSLREVLCPYVVL
jgi:hypothetical protein